MSDLDRARAQIDEIDREMARLFCRRMETVADVAAYKQQHGLPVLDAAREAAVLENNAARLEKGELTGYYTDFMQQVMRLSRQYQTERLGMGTTAYQGAEGGFGHQVAKSMYPHATLLALATFADVFDAVEDGRAAFGVVPFENSNTGDVTGVLDLCYSHRCYITAMYDLPVSQNLLGVPGATLGDIRRVYSHVQALQQSRRFLESLDVQQMPYANTAQAARFVAQSGDKTMAAIASLESAALYGLVPLAADIATQADNTTRFIIISREKPTAGDRFSLLVSVENTVGQLARVIETIAAAGFNMENIKSRPMQGRPWEYYFYIELVGTPGAEEGRRLLVELENTCLSARLLGLYYRSTQQNAG